MKHIADIIERGIREHPELSVGMQTEGIEVRSVGNTLTLHETALIEAFNLKAAIEYVLKNWPPQHLEDKDWKSTIPTLEAESTKTEQNKNKRGNNNTLTQQPHMRGRHQRMRKPQNTSQP